MKSFRCLLLIAAVMVLITSAVPSEASACGGRGGWYPGKAIVRAVANRRQRARSRGGWYLGKHLGRGGGRACARACR